MVLAPTIHTPARALWDRFELERRQDLPVVPLLSPRKPAPLLITWLPSSVTETPPEPVGTSRIPVPALTPPLLLIIVL